MRDTDFYKLVDAGYGKILKTLMEQEHHNYLNDDKHANRWYGNEKLSSAKERQIIITYWIGEA